MSQPETPSRSAVPFREIAFGIGVVGAALWLTFFASPGQVQVATLALAVITLIWFASVEPGRLLTPTGGLQPMLFGLTGLGVVVVGTAAIVFRTATLFLVAAVAASGWLTGVIRAVRILSGSPPMKT